MMLQILIMGPYPPKIPLTKIWVCRRHGAWNIFLKRGGLVERRGGCEKGEGGWHFLTGTFSHMIFRDFNFSCCDIFIQKYLLNYLCPIFVNSKFSACKTQNFRRFAPFWSGLYIVFAHTGSQFVCLCL